MKYRVAVFASGKGTNTENLIVYFKAHRSIKISLVLTNSDTAGVLEKAQKHDVETVVFTKTELYDETIAQRLQTSQIDFIVLAGFLWMFPTTILNKYPNKVVNIHPALLPKYGGKGMYGMHVHRAVVAQGERKTGITIHFVNEHYDEGEIIFQTQVQLTPTDTPETVAEKIHTLEQEHFPKVVEKVIMERYGKI